VKATLLAEFEAPEALLDAIRELRRRGYRDLDAFTPYPVKGVEQALGARRSPINWLILPLWVVAVAGAFLVQWWCNGINYPLDVGGRPLFSVPAFVPITFEMGVLAASLGAFVLFFALAGLPALYHRVFTVDGFERASRDRFFLGVDADDPAFDHRDLSHALERLGATKVTLAEEARP
jgi:hypothetical protein